MTHRFIVFTSHSEQPASRKEHVAWRPSRGALGKQPSLVTLLSSVMGGADDCLDQQLAWKRFR
jgi:hypothetical protein